MTEQPNTAAGRVLRMDWISEGRWSRDPQWLTARILAIEAEARQQDGLGLLEQVGNALVAVHTAEDGNGVPLVELMDADLFGVVTEAVAAYSRRLAALPPSAPAALNVERLAKALRTHYRDHPDAGYSHFRCAEELAAEYARLQEQER